MLIEELNMNAKTFLSGTWLLVMAATVVLVLGAVGVGTAQAGGRVYFGYGSPGYVYGAPYAPYYPYPYYGYGYAPYYSPPVVVVPGPAYRPYVGFGYGYGGYGYRWFHGGRGGHRR
jgi:hypothetical protein